MQESTIPHPSDNEHKSRKDGWRSFVSFAIIIVSALVIATLLTNFVFQSYEVEGSSMANTLHDHDRLIVLKTGKTWATITRKKFIPKRGDIVIFNRPENAGLSDLNDKQLIKRVIGLPGERVVVKDGFLHIYNKEHPEGFSPDANAPYTIIGGFTGGEKDLVVPDGQVFVCGDNRENSLDSRSFGPIDTKSIVGSLALRVYPFNQVDAY